MVKTLRVGQKWVAEWSKMRKNWNPTPYQSVKRGYYWGVFQNVKHTVKSDTG